MAKQYPPILNGILPAFEKSNSGGLSIQIPFTMNKTVNVHDIDGFALLIKTVSTGSILTTVLIHATTLNGSKTIPGWDQGKNIVTFSGIDTDLFKIGQYYKVQLAYLTKEGSTYAVGYYSSAATIKCTASPTVTIENLTAGEINTSESKFIGFYHNAHDKTEKVYSYRFDVYDHKNVLYDTSGDQLHNSYEDTTADGSRDTFSLNKDLQLNETYSICYTVTTNNQLVQSSVRYQILQKETIDPDIKVAVQAINHGDQGYIHVSLKGELNADGIEPAAIGSFYLKRASNKDNFGTWEMVYQFKLNGQLPSSWSWKDMTVEHGYTYKYALQQYSDYLISNRIESNAVKAEFEDAFLFDGEKQLRLRFNPKVTSFKTTRLEAKQDTIGSKYPFFFRNGKVGYKEFPISGLLSYQSDNEELFLSAQDLRLKQDDVRSTNLTDENITAERIFKMSVLDWLGNGQPKIFRSPTEGNFIVRLMNISLSPNDTLGRMLHTFSATAYEISDFNYKNIVELKFLHVGSLEEETTTRWATINLEELSPAPQSSEVVIFNHNTLSMSAFTISDANPGDKFQVEFKNSAESVDFVIGATGMYKLDLGNDIKISKLAYIGNGSPSGLLTYSYDSAVQNVFDTVRDVHINNWIFTQYIGAHRDLVGEMEDYISYKKNGVKDESFQGLKTRLLNIKHLTFSKRFVYDIYQYKNNYYWDAQCSNAVLNLEPIHMYRVTTVKSQSSGTGLELTDEVQFYDPLNDSMSQTCEYTIVLNQESTIDITDTGVFMVPSDCHFTSIKIANGVVCECAYQTKEIVYSLEQEDSNISTLKQKMIDAKEVYDSWNYLLDNKQKGLDFKFTTNNTLVCTTTKTTANSTTKVDSSPLLQLSDEVGANQFTDFYFNSVASYWTAYQDAKLKFLIALYEKIEEQKEATGYYV